MSIWPCNLSGLERGCMIALPCKSLALNGSCKGKDAERDSAPAENLLVELLALPGKQGLSTLILIDEVLMYAREKVGLDPAWRGRLPPHGAVRPNPADSDARF